MSANGGEGEVVRKNVALDTTFCEPKLILNRHANGKDWWLLNPQADNDIYNIYLVDSSGIHLHHQQATGLIDDYSNIGGDQLVFSPMGNQLIRFSIQLGLSLHDFDRTTGELSNFQLLPFPQGGPEVFGFSGTAISPSGQFAYVTKVTEVYQYDLWAEDIAASQYLVAELVDDGAMLLPPTVQNMQLGPDCKIYAYMVNGDRHHIIHNPDERSDACDWEQGGLLLGRYVFRDQPIFPNFRLGPLGDEGSPCASPIVSIGEPEAEQSAIARVFPNPVGPELSYSVQDVGVLRTAFFDGLGRLVIANPDRLTAGAIGKLALVGVPSGPYVLRLYLADGRVVVRKVVVR
jgi:hypothetical protein